jgi:uncharacterized membrane protein
MRAVEITLALAYPVLVYVALSWMEPRVVGACALALVAARVLVASPRRFWSYLRAFRFAALAVGLVVAVSIAWNSPLALLLTPSFISAAVLSAFARSLWADQSLIERFAREEKPELSVPEVAYCRRVTWAWCGFLFLNSVVALVLALQTSREIWALYTGLVAYMLMGLLFAGEYAYRQWRFPGESGISPWRRLVERSQSVR